MSDKVKSIVLGAAIVCGLVLIVGYGQVRTANRVRADIKRVEAEISKRPGVTSGARAVAALNVSIKEWDVPTKGAHPHDPAVAPDGSLWFTEQLQNKLGRLDPVAGTFR